MSSNLDACNKVRGNYVSILCVYVPFLEGTGKNIGMPLNRCEGRHRFWSAMTQIKSKLKTAMAALVVVLTAVLAVSAAHSLGQAYAQTSSAQYSVNIAYKAGIGSYLTNATGFALYTFEHDIPSNGTSRCTGQCLQIWPAFYAANLTLPSGLSATSFTVITRPDGSKQLAYDGWPLYYFIKDTSPGDTNGQGVGNLWSVCTLPTPFAIPLTSSTSGSTATATTTAPGSGW
jgi:predicted lipoprotein with Yx(FWY)xxD motif